MSIFENIFYLLSCGIFENVFVVLMGRMILITPRAARVIIQKKTLDKWPCWHDTCHPPLKKKFKKMIFIVAIFGQFRHAFVHAGKFLR